MCSRKTIFFFEKMLLTYYDINNLANKFHHTSFRFLATRDIFRTISFSFRLGHSTVQSNIQDVCKSIIKHLKHEVGSIPIRTNWSQIVNDFGTCGTFLIALVEMSYNLCEI